MDAMKLLGSLMNNQSLSSGLGKQLLGGLLGGGQQQQRAPQGGGGLAALLGGVLGGGGQQQSANPMAGILGSLLGGGGNAGGGSSAASGIAGMLGGMLGGGGQAASQQQPQRAAVAPQPAVDPNQAAVLMIRAMVNAAKSDGRIDEQEQQKIISKLGNDVDQAEINFLKQEFAAPLDVAGFARSIPQGLEQQIYAMSLTSIDLDTQNEAQYLGQLAQGLKMDPRVCNQIHDQVGAPKIFG